VKLGAISFMTDYSIAPSEFARELEAHGYESFWAGDHTHIPVEGDPSATILDSRTNLPLQPEYWHLMDPFVVLANAAAATSRILLGIGITLINERDPIVTAKQVASLDHLSGGRFLFGIGGGWNVAEMRNHGTDARFKWRIMRERVAAMREIWTKDVAEFHGEFVDFTPLMSWPKPIQKPGPPVLIGGNDRNIPRVVEYGDGWAPGVINLPTEVFTEQIAELQRQAEAAGRGRLPVTAFHVTPVADLEVGSALELTDRQWDAYERAGVDRVVVMFPPWRDKNLALVERLARFAG
jgi:probable F420-dependent oxidoreductase